MVFAKSDNWTYHVMVGMAFTNVSFSNIFKSLHKYFLKKNETIENKAFRNHGGNQWFEHKNDANSGTSFS